MFELRLAGGGGRAGWTGEKNDAGEVGKGSSARF